MIGFSNATEINKVLHINSVSVMTRLVSGLEPSRVRQADGRKASRGSAALQPFPGPRAVLLGGRSDIPVRAWTSLSLFIMWSHL